MKLNCWSARALTFTAFLATALIGSASAGETYEAAPAWPRIPEGVVLGQATGVDVDARGRVFVFHRADRVWSGPMPRSVIEHPTVFVLDAQTGTLLQRWGASRFIMPHGLTVDARGDVWLTDVGLHQVFKFSADGALLLAVGAAGKPGRGKRRFNRPTDVAVLEDGSFYVSDGYRNTRIVKFTAKGEYQFEWGARGGGAGEFRVPHGIAVDAKGRVYVADRENARIQVFDAHGGFLMQWRSGELGRPYAIAVRGPDFAAIADGGDPAGAAIGRSALVLVNGQGDAMQRVGRFGTGVGEFEMAHDVAISPDGAIYVADARGKRLQKFVRTQDRTIGAPSSPNHVR